MGQKLVRTEIRKGLRAYDEHRYDEAVQTWQTVLARVKDDSKKFEILGYLLRAHEDAGRLKQMLLNSVAQLNLITARYQAKQKKRKDRKVSKSNKKKVKKESKKTRKTNEYYWKHLSVAYLNLARSNVKLCEYHKAICYSHHCIQTEMLLNGKGSNDLTTLPRYSPLVVTLSPVASISHLPLHGYAYLTQAQAYVGLGEFPKALQHYDVALEVANARCDSILAMLVCIGYGDMFLSLGDTFSALGWYKRAYGHLKTPKISETRSGPQLCPVTPAASRYQRLLNQRVSDCNRKMGRTVEAMETCEEAMRLALKHSDRLLQGKCLITFAKIHNSNNDIDRSVPRFECALSILSEIGFRSGEAEAFQGLADTAASQRNFRSAIDFNLKALNTSRAIGSKLIMLKCHENLKGLYGWLNEKDKSAFHDRYAQQLILEMDLRCDVCGETIGNVRARLDHLSCGHIIHNRCASHLSRSTLGRSNRKRPCPSCRRKSFLDPMCYA
ncbi:43 kDa receptor-associated protein of the synapse [Octopus bimaculoides]|nr:43 kDa receptor-associated protein of the synapse [Octopus bimaculoides]|eukprot:XP_014787963.1 PREDICTED: 43 kDa receptor-associated protein of the synapse-like [Octopus bimaculoides]